VPLQTVPLEAIEHQPSSRQSALVFPAQRGGYLDLHNFRNREWKPAQLAAGIEPLRRFYDLRHTFATFALRTRACDPPPRRAERCTTATVDAAWTPEPAAAAGRDNGNTG
jgi:integrase